MKVCAVHCRFHLFVCTVLSFVLYVLNLREMIFIDCIYRPYIEQCKSELFNSWLRASLMYGTEARDN